MKHFHDAMPLLLSLVPVFYEFNRLLQLHVGLVPPRTAVEGFAFTGLSLGRGLLDKFGLLCPVGAG